MDIKNLIAPEIADIVNIDKAQEVANTKPRYNVGDRVNIRTCNCKMIGYTVEDVKITKLNKIYIWGYTVTKNGNKPFPNDKYIVECCLEPFFDARLSKDEYYLGIADAVNKRSTCLRRRYGAVLVKNDEIVSTGYNGSPRGEDNCCDLGYCDREAKNIPKGERYELCVAIHAEDNAITSASRSRADGATLYIVGRNVADESLASSAPCLMCRRKIVNAGIKRVVGYVNGEIKDISVEDIN